LGLCKEGLFSLLAEEFGVINISNNCRLSIENYLPFEENVQLNICIENQFPG
jgi:hypothetical protein